MTAPIVSPLLKYIDGDGKLTREGLELFAALLRQIAELEARVVALEA